MNLRRNRQQQVFYDKPARERHFLSIIGSVLSIVLLILAMALREWAKGNDANCEIVFGLTQVQIQNIGNPSLNGLKPSMCVCVYEYAVYYFCISFLYLCGGEAHSI